MNKRMIIAALALGGVFLAAYLTLFHYGYIGSLACGSATGACERVQSSRWSMFLGLPVALWGAGFYVTTFAVATAGVMGRWSESRGVSAVLVALTGWGVVFSGYLTWAEAVRIGAYCRFCVVSAILVVVLFALSVLDWREERAAPAE